MHAARATNSICCNQLRLFLRDFFLWLISCFCCCLWCSRAQSQLGQGLKLPAGGVICLSSNQTKMAGKPVYFFLSTGASVHVPRWETHIVFGTCVLPCDLTHLRLPVLPSVACVQGKRRPRSVHTASWATQRHIRQGSCVRLPTYVSLKTGSTLIVLLPLRCQTLSTRQPANS